MIQKLIIGAFILGSFLLQAAKAQTLVYEDPKITRSQPQISKHYSETLTIEKIPLAVKKASQAAAKIKVTDPSGYYYSGGSGFFVNDSKTFVTNFHVIQHSLMIPESDPLHWSQSLKIIHNGKTYPIKGVKNLSVRRDLAVLEIEGYSGDFLKLSDKIPSGRVYAIGFPKGSHHIIPADVLYYGDGGIEFFLSFHRPFHKETKGLSGGSVVNEHGDVIGIHHARCDETSLSIHTLMLKQLLEKDLPSPSNIIHTIQDQMLSMYDSAYLFFLNFKFLPLYLLFCTMNYGEKVEG